MAPLGLIIAPIGFFYLLSKGKHESIILFFVLMLILGDSRIPWLQYIKHTRIELLVLIAGFSIYEIRRGVYQLSKYYLYFLPFFFIALLSLAFSPILSLGIQKTFSFALLYFVLLHYIRHRFTYNGQEIIRDLLYMFHFILLIGLVLLPIFPVVVSFGGVRFNGLLGNPNGLGIFITLVTPLTILVFKYTPQISKRYRTLAWFLIILSLILCSSRNAIFSFTIFMLLYQGLNGTTFKRFIFIFVFLPIAVLVVYNIELESLVVSLGLEKYFRIKDFESGSGRIFAWQHAWDLVQVNPLIGCGFACEEYNFIFKTTYRLWATGHQGGVHNSYLAYLVNTGYIGFFMYIGFLFSIIRKAIDRNFLFPYLAAVMFSAMFESWVFSSLSAYHIIFVLTIVWLNASAEQPVLMEAEPVNRSNLPKIQGFS